MMHMLARLSAGAYPINEAAALKLIVYLAVETLHVHFVYI
jgi:hypothetical protein